MTFPREALCELVTPPAGNIPALDALRTVAILMVIMYHSSQRFSWQSDQGDSFANLIFVSGGWRGVDLFFVLSGYLIGRQLWRELRTTGTIQLGRFIVLRRGFRIWPLYYFSLALWLIGSVDGRATFSSFRWWTEAAFLSNYLPGGIQPGSWSLCIEEQFYLMAPLLILAFAGFARHRDPSSFRPWLIALFVAEPVVRALTLQLNGHPWSSSEEVYMPLIYKPIHTHADSLLIGMLLANLADNRRPDRPGKATAFLIAAAFLVVVGRKAGQGVFSFSGCALLFGALTWLALSLPRLSAPFFGSWVCFVISRLSFGMYLNHQLIVEWIAPAGSGVFRASGMPLALADAAFVGIVGLASAVTAVATYCLIEWPSLRFRDRLLAHDKGSRAKPQGQGELMPSNDKAGKTEAGVA